MRRLQAALIFVALSMLVVPTAHAAGTAGTKCAVGGSKKTVDSKIYTCTSAKRWNAGVKITKPKPTARPSVAATAIITCPVKGNCEIGNRGPGGGIVFYVAPTPQPWGQYLEAAPATWNGTKTDPTIAWCDGVDASLVSTVTDPGLLKLLGTEIGKGQGDTQLMSTACKSGAANLVSAYRGGGKSDWFLPSMDELNKLYQNKTATYASIVVSGGKSSSTVEHETIIGDLASGSYWSSSENDAMSAWSQRFYGGYQENMPKGGTLYVRPIRAFS